MNSRSKFVALAVSPILIAASQPVRLKPSSNWVVDYAENSCRLSRTFGEGDLETTLLLESISPGGVDMLVIGNPLRNGSQEALAHFLPNQTHQAKGRMVRSADKQRPAAIYSNIWLFPDDLQAKYDAYWELARKHPRIRPPAISVADQQSDRERRRQFTAAATELELETRRDHPVILETGSMGEPIKALDECARDSLRDWGIDPDQSEQVVRGPWAADRNSWFRPNDYPIAMLRQGMQSDVKARVLLDASGRVTKCDSLSHFDLPEFNKLVCNSIMRSARFEPAEISDGTKVPSYTIMTVSYRIGHW